LTTLEPYSISRSLATGQGHMVFVPVFFCVCAWCCSYPWTVLSLEHGL